MAAGGSEREDWPFPCPAIATDGAATAWDRLGSVLLSPSVVVVLAGRGGVRACASRSCALQQSYAHLLSVSPCPARPNHTRAALRTTTLNKSILQKRPAGR